MFHRVECFFNFLWVESSFMGVRIVWALIGLLGFAGTGYGESALSELSLKTFRGQTWRLEDERESEFVVVVFLGTECPLARLYGPRLQQLHEQFSERGVSFVGINSNRQDSVTEIGFYVEKAGIRFPMLKDVGNKAADALNAVRTPEVFVLNAAGNVVYQGRIDDQYQPGISRDKVQRRDLAIALEELLSGQAPSVPRTEPEGCYIGRVKKVEPHGEITYNNQIVRIINDHCLECHRSGQIAPFTLTSYEDILGWEDTILEVIGENRMPPWFADPAHGKFSNDSRLTPRQKKLIRKWVSNGMPEGNAADLPEPPQFAEGWRMPGSADDIDIIQIFESDEEAFRVPAEGVVDYKYFEVDPGWTEDKYVVAAEARPGNKSVVHHIIAYVIEPGEEERRQRRMLVGYAPGSLPQVLTDGRAIHVKAGSRLLFEMHYTPNGTPQKDRSYIGLRYTDRKNVKRTLNGGAVVKEKLNILPRLDNQTASNEVRIPRDQILLDMTPHMHLRGKSFEYTLIRKDGSQETLLKVPRYDFNWQLSYKLAEPKKLINGDTIRCVATYDNSADNPANPNPDATVKWGDQSFDEMMIGFFTTVDPD